MKTTIITSVITTLLTLLVVKHSVLTTWIACGIIANMICNKYHLNAHNECMRLNHRQPIAYVFVVFGPITLAVMLCIFWSKIKDSIPFKFQSPITKVKSDVVSE